MKNEIYDSMLSRYNLMTEQSKRNAMFEVNQQVSKVESAFLKDNTDVYDVMFQRNNRLYTMR